MEVEKEAGVRGGGGEEGAWSDYPTIEWGFNIGMLLSIAMGF